MLVLLAVAEVAAWGELARAVRRGRSVYGISHDMVVVAAVDLVVAAATTASYTTDRIRRMYEARNSHRELVVDWWLVPVEWVRVAVVMVLAAQLYRYRASGHRDQHVSRLCLGSVGLGVALFAWVAFVVVQRPQKRLNALDLVDLAWSLGQLCRITRLAPQVVMNWVDSSNYVPRNVIHCLLLAWTLLLAEKIVTAKTIQWYQRPVNYWNSWLALMVTLPLLVLLKLQKSYWYHNKAGYMRMSLKGVRDEDAERAEV